jgi:hypothetical protein
MAIIRWVLTSNVQKLARLGILATTVVWAAPFPESPKPLSAYYESTSVQFAPDLAGKGRTASLGPWIFGKRLPQDKPLDKRLNLYVVIPGKQYRSPTAPEYDHNLVVNVLSHDQVKEWDIFWCFVLDPGLDSDFRNEHDLLVAAHQSFIPADLFDVEDIPGHEVLQEKTGIQSLADLNHYRHKDGSLPRLVILPAHLAVSASAFLTDENNDKAASH